MNRGEGAMLVRVVAAVMLKTWEGSATTSGVTIQCTEKVRSSQFQVHHGGYGKFIVGGLYGSEYGMG